MPFKYRLPTSAGFHDFEADNAFKAVKAYGEKYGKRHFSLDSLEVFVNDTWLNAALVVAENGGYGDGE